MVKSSKGLLILKIVLITAGAFFLLWYLAPLAAGIFNEGNAAGIVFSAAALLCGVFFERIPPRLRLAAVCVFAAAAVAFASLSAYMAHWMNYRSAPEYGAKTVIVLGCRVDGSVPSLQLKNRCAAAAEFMLQVPDSVAVLSGGQGPDEDISEAECMKRLLVEAGIDESRLYLEESSANTRENLENSLAVIKKNGLSQSVLVVTNEYHQCRAMLICRDLGITAGSDFGYGLFHSKSCKTSAYSFLTFLTRDMMGVVKELIF